MRINKDSLKARVNNIAHQLNISQNTIYNRFFFDAFLSRLAISKYNEKFILKGGLYLSSLLGIESRSTIDIDFYLKKIRLEKGILFKVIQEILNTSIDDGINFQIVKIEDIRMDDFYGGFQINIIGQLENVRHTFSIDVATGDPIIPSEKNYSYKCLVSGEVLPLKTYSLESVIAEKLQTVLARQIANSRSKDFYDLHILRKTQYENINKEFLQSAFIETCNYRNFHITKNDALLLINEIGSNSLLQTRWDAYIKRADYAQRIAFSDVIESIINWVEDAIK